MIFAQSLDRIQGTNSTYLQLGHGPLLHLLTVVLLFLRPQLLPRGGGLACCRAGVRVQLEVLQQLLGLVNKIIIASFNIEVG